MINDKYLKQVRERGCDAAKNGLPCVYISTVSDLGLPREEIKEIWVQGWRAYHHDHTETFDDHEEVGQPVDTAFHKGLHTYRLKHNPNEAIFAEAWRKMNERYTGRPNGVLAYLLAPAPGAPDYKFTERDAQVAATVIQWLGSPIGFVFLAETFAKCNRYPQDQVNEFLKATTCSREDNHDGPCNGWPRKVCKG